MYLRWLHELCEISPVLSHELFISKRLQYKHVLGRPVHAICPGCHSQTVKVCPRHSRTGEWTLMMSDRNAAMCLLRQGSGQNLHIFLSRLEACNMLDNLSNDRRASEGLKGPPSCHNCQLTVPYFWPSAVAIKLLIQVPQTPHQDGEVLQQRRVKKSNRLLRHFSCILMPDRCPDTWQQTVTLLQCLSRVVLCDLALLPVGWLSCYVVTKYP